MPAENSERDMRISTGSAKRGFDVTTRASVAERGEGSGIAIAAVSNIDDILEFTDGDAAYFPLTDALGSVVAIRTDWACGASGSAAALAALTGAHGPAATDYGYAFNRPTSVFVGQVQSNRPAMGVLISATKIAAVGQPGLRAALALGGPCQR